MKKRIFITVTLLLIGVVLGTKIYSAKASIENVFAEGQTYYFLQEGIYSSKKIMEETWMIA